MPANQHYHATPKRHECSAANLSALSAIKNHQTQEADNHLKRNSSIYRFSVMGRDWE